MSDLLSEFRRYTPAELMRLANVNEESEDSIEGQLTGTEVQKLRLKKQATEKMERKVDILNKAMGTNRLKIKDLAPVSAENIGLEVANNMQQMINKYDFSQLTLLQQRQIENAVAAAMAANKAAQPALPATESATAGTESTVTAEDVTDRYEELEGVEQQFAEQTAEKTRNARSTLYTNIKDAFNIITAVHKKASQKTSPYHIEVKFVDDDVHQIWASNDYVKATIDVILGHTRPAKPKVIEMLNEVTNIAREKFPERFPLRVELPGGHVCLLVSTNKFSDVTIPDDVDYVNWEPFVRGHGLSGSKRQNTFYVNQSGKFGSAIIDLMELQLNKHLVAVVNGQEVANEEVSNGLYSLLTSKAYSKKTVKAEDLVRFKELLSMFAYEPTTRVKKTAKYLSVFASAETQLAEPTIIDIGRNIQAFAAGNTSSTLLKDTFNELDRQLKAGEIGKDTYTEYVGRISSLLNM